MRASSSSIINLLGSLVLFKFSNSTTRIPCFFMHPGERHFDLRQRMLSPKQEDLFRQEVFSQNVCGGMTWMRKRVVGSSHCLSASACLSQAWPCITSNEFQNYAKADPPRLPWLIVSSEIGPNTFEHRTTRSPRRCGSDRQGSGSVPG